MRTSAERYEYWRNRGDGSFDAVFTGPVNPELSLPNLFVDPRVKLADVNGDRLVDLVLVERGRVHYWAHMGWGRWAPMATLENAPDAGPDQHRVELADLDGDGRVDAFLATGERLALWLRQADGGFAPPLELRGMPRADPASVVVRAADMNGSGTTDIVYSRHGAEVSWKYVDLSGGVRPRLLETIENGLGKTHRFRYRSSSELYQQARVAGAPWSTRLPIAAQLLTEVVTTDGRGWSDSQHFNYRDGYYDGESRQFRGFAETSVTAPGDAHVEPALRIERFDVGATDEALKGRLLASEVWRLRPRDASLSGPRARFSRARAPARVSSRLRPGAGVAHCVSRPGRARSALPLRRAVAPWRRDRAW